MSSTARVKRTERSVVRDGVIAKNLITRHRFLWDEKENQIFLRHFDVFPPTENSPRPAGIDSLMQRLDLHGYEKIVTSEGKNVNKILRDKVLSKMRTVRNLYKAGARADPEAESDDEMDNASESESEADAVSEEEGEDDQEGDDAQDDDHVEGDRREAEDADGPKTPKGKGKAPVKSIKTRTPRKTIPKQVSSRNTTDTPPATTSGSSATSDEERLLAVIQTQMRAMIREAISDAMKEESDNSNNGTSQQAETMFRQPASLPTPRSTPEPTPPSTPAVFGTKTPSMFEPTKISGEAVSDNPFRRNH